MCTEPKLGDVGFGLESMAPAAAGRLARLSAHVRGSAAAATAVATVPGAELEGRGGRMGGQLGSPGARSDDPRDPTLEVGTVKLYEDERIRVWDMCVPPGADTSFHRHVHDYVHVQVQAPGTPGLCTVENVDVATGAVTASGEVSEVGAKACAFRAASEDNPAVHRLSNPPGAEANYRQILIEFLEPEPRHSQEEVEECLSNAALTTEVGTGLLFQNHRCRIHEFFLPPHSGQDLPYHHHTLPYFFVNVCGGPNAPGVGFHGLAGFTDRTETDTFQLWSQDRDMSFQNVPFGGFVDGEAVHVDKVWNDSDQPYQSFIVELL